MRKVPDVVGLLNIGVRVALLRVDKIRKFQRIADEKDRRIVADQVVVAILGVELDRKAARVANGIGGALLSRHGRETNEYLGSFSNRGKEFGLGPPRHIGQHFEIPIGARALGVHDALGNPLAIEVRELLDQVMILNQNRASGGRRCANSDCR